MADEEQQHADSPPEEQSPPPPRDPTIAGTRSAVPKPDSKPKPQDDEHEVS